MKSEQQLATLRATFAQLFENDSTAAQPAEHKPHSVSYFAGQIEAFQTDYLQDFVHEQRMLSSADEDCCEPLVFAHKPNTSITVLFRTRDFDGQ